MDNAFEPAPRRCADLVCRRSGACRRPFASACLTSPGNANVRRQRIADKLDKFLRDSGIDPDGPPPPDALPIEETLAIIRDEIRSRRSNRPPAPGRRGRRASPASPPGRRG
jgi:hypothetical protein